MSKKSAIDKNTDSEDSLFRQAVAGTRPLKSTVERHQYRQAPREQVVRRNTKATIEYSDLEPPSSQLQAVETDQELIFLRPGLQKKYLRKLRRRQYPIEDSLDLHGMRQGQAESILLEFINHARDQQFHCIRIIHGKGLRSESTRPALKLLCNHFLRRHPAVMAFVSAAANDGGGGAVYVLLKPHKGIESLADKRQY